MVDSATIFIVRRSGAPTLGKVTMRRALIALLFLIGLTLAPLSPALAGGNSTVAKQCQKNGWTTLYRSDGSMFTSETDCVSYGAQGGTILTAPPATLVYSQGLRCDVECDWGEVQGTGLLPGSFVQTYGSIPRSPTNPIPVDQFVVAQDGTVHEIDGLACGVGWHDLYAVATTASGATIESNHVDSPCG
jgi:hypothetical protein